MLWTINLVVLIPCFHWLSSKLMPQTLTISSQVSFKWWTWQEVKDNLLLEIRLIRNPSISTNRYSHSDKSSLPWQTKRLKQPISISPIESPNWPPCWDIPWVATRTVLWSPAWILVTYTSKRTSTPFNTLARLATFRTSQSKTMTPRCVWLSNWRRKTRSFMRSFHRRTRRFNSWASSLEPTRRLFRATWKTFRCPATILWTPMQLTKKVKARDKTRPLQPEPNEGQELTPLRDA